MFKIFKIIIKYVASYFKKDWQIFDYPIEFKKFDITNQELPDRFNPIQWTARIINWYQICGNGETKEEAFQDLINIFNNRKARGDKIARPGTGLPVELASTDKIMMYEDIAEHFFRNILDVDYKQVFISDESSLWDIPMLESLQPIYKKIKEIYGVDISDSDNKFLTVFEKIKNR